MMRHRRQLQLLLSVSVFLLYFGQILLGAGHFLSTDHGVVTGHGELGHGHQDADHGRADEGLSAACPPDGHPSCRFLDVILRVSDGVQRTSAPLAGLAGQPGRDGVRPRRDRIPGISSLLAEAPKHSPPFTS
jgi:hypothetical protein